MCRELDFDVCATNAAEADAKIVLRYAELLHELPDIDLECVSAWTMVQCSAAFHWALSDASSTVCRRTCKMFVHACARYGIVDDDRSCGVEAYGDTRGGRCEDYASRVEGRCYEVDDDDRRHYHLLQTNGAPDTWDRDELTALMACVALVWVLYNKLPL